MRLALPPAERPRRASALGALVSRLLSTRRGSSPRTFKEFAMKTFFNLTVAVGVGLAATAAWAQEDPAASDPIQNSGDLGDTDKNDDGIVDEQERHDVLVDPDE